ncbi:MAG TPA: preprotein translocase subunit SecA, partial [Desulfovibrio sp.]|nr:preprotein translocase subunit SecA [Desulfovibrio sp.]
YGQRDPKQEYKREGFSLFQDMLFRVRENLFRALTRLRIQREEQAPPEELKQEFKHKEEPKSLNYSGAQKETPSAAPERRAEPKVGRNDPCPCGSGQKYKKCCGA